MKLLDLFSGIGGFSLAAEWVWGDDLEIVGFVENDKYCQRVLKKRWPGVQQWTDVRTFGYNSLYYSMYKNVDVDLITGGFPCQDISIAGKGVGIEGKRSGLWVEFKRIIGEIRPKFALIENVPMLTHRGLGRVLSDLTEIGYNAEWQSISAAEMGAWHKRERIWIVAYKVNSNPRYSELDRQRNESRIQGGSRSQPKPTTLGKTFSNSHRKSVLAQRKTDKPVKESNGEWNNNGRRSSDNDKLSELRFCSEKNISNTERTGINKGWEGQPFFESWEDSTNVPHTQRERFDKGYITETRQATRLSGQQFQYWEVEPNVGRVAHGIPSRVDRLKCLGNAIVPQVAYVIMLKIKEVMDENFI